MTSIRSSRAIDGMRCLATAIVAALALANTAQPAHAVSAYLTAFEEQYPAAVGSRIDTCGVCHTSSIPQLNPYGQAFQAAGHEFAPIEAADSDGDGFSNLTEITALTFPGDPGDSPPSPSPSPTLASETQTATPTITVQVNNTPTVTAGESPTATPTNTSEGATVTPTTPSGSPAATATNTSGAPTVTPTLPSGSPTNTILANTPTATRGGGSPTVSPITTRTATSGPAFNAEDDGCSIVAPARSSAGGGLALLLAPALLVWLSRRRS